jgi:hypothetical protein
LVVFLSSAALRRMSVNVGDEKKFGDVKAAPDERGFTG